MSSLYKFVYGKKAIVNKGSKTVFMVSNLRDASIFSMKQDEFELAELFDGNRSAEEVLDAFFIQRKIRLNRDHLNDFVYNLVETGLLQELPSAASSIDVSSFYRMLARGGESIAGDAAEDRRADSTNAVEAIEEAAESVQKTPAPAMRARTVKRPQSGGAIEAGDDLAEEAARMIFADVHESSPSTTDASADSVDSMKLDVDVLGNWRGHAKGSTLPVMKPRILVRLPVRWLLWAGKLLNLGARNRWLMLLTGVVVAAACFGLWQHHIEAFRDLWRAYGPLSLAQVLLISMFTVNLLVQAARAAAVHTLTGKVPPFGIIVAFYFLPRFYTDTSSAGVRGRMQFRYLWRSPISATLLLFASGVFGWLVTMQAGTFLPLLLIAVALMAVITFIFTINPLAQRDGYLLLADSLGIPNLRERALAALFARDYPGQGWFQQGDEGSPWGVRIYGILVVVYLVAVSVLITMFAGGYLERRWGGAGVALFLFLTGLVLIQPIRQVRARARARMETASRIQLYVGGQAVRRTRSRVRGLIVSLVVLSLVAYLGSQPYTYEAGGDFVVLPTLRATVAPVIRGDVREIFVKEGDRVQQGQLIARLADDEERHGIEQTEAALAGLRAELAKLRQGARPEEIALAKQQLQTAITRAGFSRDKAKRLEDLEKRDLASRQDYEDALSEAEVDAQLVAEARKNLDLVESGARPEDVAALEAQIAKAESQLAYHKARLSYTELRAVIAGRIASGSLQYSKGDYLEEGDVLATIENTEGVQVEIKVPEFDIGEVKVGMPVRVKTWAYPDLQFYGLVSRIAPVVEDSTYGKVVRVTTEITNHDGMFKSDLTGYGKIASETRPALLAFTRAIWRFITVEIWSWIP